MELRICYVGVEMANNWFGDEADSGEPLGNDASAISGIVDARPNVLSVWRIYCVCEGAEEGKNI